MKLVVQWLGLGLLLMLMTGCAAPSREAWPALSAWNGEDARTVLEQRTPQVAQRYMGLPYRYAANPDKVNATDCSNLVSAVTRNSLEGTPYRFQPYYLSTVEITKRTDPVSKEQVRAGDLIIFRQEKGKESEHHSGLVTGVEDGVVRFVHASSMVGVQEIDTTSKGWTGYWAKRLHSFRRWKSEIFAMAKN